MPLNRPDKDELLEAVTEYLKAPITNRKADGFFRRVAANVLTTVQRENQLAEEFNQFEQDQLKAFVADSSTDINKSLCDSIRSGQQDISDQLVSALKSISEQKLKIDNPKYLR